jgi:hypothetical protein
MIVQLVADIRNQLFWRVGWPVSERCVPAARLSDRLRTAMDGRAEAVIFGTCPGFRDQGGWRPREGEGRPGEYHQRSS